MDRIGRYKIERELGRGAMGVVYLATDPSIGRSVAIKTIRLGDVSNVAERNKLRERLFREARSAGILSHRGIVTVYDMDDDDDVAYIAMEYVDGVTLDQLMSEEAPIPPKQMLDYLRQTAAALDYAHAKGIVHRDIKPANIMIDQDGTIKVTDFGIAKVTTSDQFTMTGTIVGTPNYMSPEQVQGQKVDGRSDQFSLAVIAYEVMTGEKPFVGEHLTTVVFKIVAEEPEPPVRLNPSIGPRIEAVLRRALSKKPDARYLSCTEFVAALEAASAASPDWKTVPRGGALESPTMDQAAPAAAAEVTTPKLPPPKRKRADMATLERKRTTILPVVLGILLAAGLAGAGLWQAMPWIVQQFGGEQQTAHNAPAPVQQPAAPTPDASQQAAKPSALGSPSPLEPPAVETHDGEKQQDAAKPSEAPAVRAQTRAEERGVADPGETPAVRRPSGAAAPATQTIWVPTNPPGATATLDGRSDHTCMTPCMLVANPGRHTVAITFPGYGVEHREVTVARDPVEIPLISMRSHSGTLMISTTPPGASITINGKLMPQTTNAVLPLPPGTYTVVLEKDGRRSSDTVKVVNGDTKILKRTLE